MDIKKPNKRSTASATTPKRPAASGSKAPTPKPTTKRPAPTKSSFLRDIDDAMRAIDSAEAQDAPSTGARATRDGHAKRGQRQRKSWSRRKKIIVWSITSLLVLLALIAGFYAYRIAQNTGGMFQGSMFDIFRNDQLKTDANGRSNILIFGTSEDDPGHSGARLADSIMVLSIDPETKDSFTVSIPRDLWVDFDTPCSVGSAGKINATYLCALEAKGGDEDAASMVFADKVSDVIGSDVQYYVAVNYSVVQGLVDALGGVDVTVHSDDPRGIYDVATGLRIASGTHSVDGQTALDLSRARNAKGGYGLSQSNFDREKNQQQVLKAIQDKALSSGTLVDPNKAVALTESLGDNVRTNVQTSELRTALDVAAGVRSDAMQSKVLNDPASPLVTTGSHQNQSIVRPIKGLTDYSDIHSFLWSDR